MTRNAFPFYGCAVEETHASLANLDGQFAEATVYDLLRGQIPAEWSFIWGVQLGVHEYDFLVMVPGRGIVNVECKGHGYQPIGATNKFTWYNHSRKCSERRDVLGQAAAARNSYIRHLGAALFNGCNHWGVMGYCVVFPLDDFQGVNFRNVPIYSKSECLSAGGMQRIVLESLDRAEQQLRDKGVWNPTRLDDDAATSIWRYWTQGQDSTCIAPLPRPIDLTGYSRRMRNILSVSQEAVLDMVQRPSTHRVLIEGRAGSGKTFLGVAIAAQASGRVLYVCFNKVLSCQVAQTLPKDPRLTVLNFHRLSAEVLGAPLNLSRCRDESEDEFWKRFDEEFWGKLKGMIPGEYTVYDTIVVDEAQDLTKTQLLILLRCCKADGKLVLLADSEQTLYANRLTRETLSGFLRNIEFFKLKHNLRNPRPVKQYCDTFASEVDNDVVLLDGPDVGKWKLPILDIDGFLKTQVLSRYNPSDIAVLSPELNILKLVGKTLDVPFYGPEGKKIREIEKNLEVWKRNGCVWKSSTHAFKGLEAMAIVHLIPQGFSYDNLLYVGGTRATHQLHIVEIDE